MMKKRKEKQEAQERKAQTNAAGGTAR